MTDWSGISFYIQYNWLDPIKPYIGHSIILLLLIIYEGITFGATPSSMQQFIERDPQLSFQTKENPQVSNSMLAALSINIPIPFILFSVFVGFTSIRNEKIAKIKYLVWLVLSFAISLLAASCITNTIKLLMGEPRPSFFDICNYHGYSDALKSGDFSLYDNITKAGRFGNIANCLNTKADTGDAFMSFPSGHSSIMFTSMTFLSMVTKFTLSNTNCCFYGIELLVSFGSYALATWVAVTRVQDYKHHTYDVFAGAILGVLIAYTVFESMLCNIKKQNLGTQQIASSMV